MAIVVCGHQEMDPMGGPCSRFQLAASQSLALNAAPRAYFLKYVHTAIARRMIVAIHRDELLISVFFAIPPILIPERAACEGVCCQ
jgi:hypothetical protein